MQLYFSNHFLIPYYK
jgi:hypothetical protein